MVPEAAVAMLACARIGAIHSVVFGGFSSESLRDRLNDAGARVLVTADQGLRGGRAVELKKLADAALADAPSVERVIVLRRTGADVPFHDGRDRWWHVEMDAPQISDLVAPEDTGAEDASLHPLHVGIHRKTEGRPPHDGGISAACVVVASRRLRLETRRRVLVRRQRRMGDGRSYVVYGPLSNGATTLMFEGVPTYPDAGRFWDVIDRHAVTVFYTAPTAIRALQAAERVRHTGLPTFAETSSARSASRSIRKHGFGITAPSATARGRSSTRGGKPKPAEFWSPFPAPRRSSRVRRRFLSRASVRVSWTMRATCSRPTGRRAICASRSRGPA
jgi:hypothetical protein